MTSWKALQIWVQRPSLKEGSLYFRPVLFLWRCVDSHSLGVWGVDHSPTPSGSPILLAT